MKKTFSTLLLVIILASLTHHYKMQSMTEKTNTNSVQCKIEMFQKLSQPQASLSSIYQIYDDNDNTVTNDKECDLSLTEVYNQIIPTEEQSTPIQNIPTLVSGWSWTSSIQKARLTEKEMLEYMLTDNHFYPNNTTHRSYIHDKFKNYHDTKETDTKNKLFQQLKENRNRAEIKTNNLLLDEFAKIDKENTDAVIKITQAIEQALHNNYLELINSLNIMKSKRELLKQQYLHEETHNSNINTLLKPFTDSSNDLHIPKNSWESIKKPLDDSALRICSAALCLKKLQEQAHELYLYLPATEESKFSPK